jgi:hypothetical protein
MPDGRYGDSTGRFGRGRDVGAGGSVPVDIAARKKFRPRRDVRAHMLDADGKVIPPTRSLTISPPEEFPIPSAQSIYENSSGLILAAGANAVIAGPSFQVPAGMVAVIRSFNIFINAPTLLTNIFFQLLVNNAPIPGMDNLQEFPRVANNISKEFERAIRIGNGSLIGCQAVNRDGAGPWTVGIEYSGWFWPQIDGENYTGLPWGI